MAFDQASGERRAAIVLEHMRLENAHDFPACVAVFGRARYEVIPTNQIYDSAAAVQGFQNDDRSAFPDFQFVPTRTVPAEGVVLVEGRFEGTHLGPWHGLPATGRKVNFPMCLVFEFDGDELINERVYFDLGTPLHQLGVAFDPLSTWGRVTTVLLHPITITKALLRKLKPHRSTPKPTA